MFLAIFSGEIPIDSTSKKVGKTHGWIGGSEALNDTIQAQWAQVMAQDDGDNLDGEIHGKIVGKIDA